MIKRWLGLPFFAVNVARYVFLTREKGFKLHLRNIIYSSWDRFEGAGVAPQHYFLQDLWAARKLYHGRVGNHVDVGSRLDGFISHLLVFSAVTFVDIRPLGREVPGLAFKKGSILALPFPDGSVESLSCLHVLEHVGLGRYGDRVEPGAYRKAATELCRVLKSGGRLLLSVPVGCERLCFDAHRIFSPDTILDMFGTLKLREFSLIDDCEVLHEKLNVFSPANTSRYGCGLFEFEKF